MSQNKNKHNNAVTVNERLTHREEIPTDLHWIPKGEFKGEIYDTQTNRYYSALAGKKYRPKHEEKHLDQGHYQGYRFAIETYTEKYENVFDPTIGSGTAAIEAVNLGRNGYGIELEWPDMAIKNIEHQGTNQHWKIYPGNAKDILSIMPIDFRCHLIINGTPYPTKGRDGGLSADGPLSIKDNKLENKNNYQNPNSFGLLGYPSGGYEKFIRKMYKDCDRYLKPGGYLCLLIKDPVRDKKPFLLQEMLIDWIKKDNGYEDHSWFIHKHIPQTFAMRAYKNKHPEVTIPLYQIGVVLKKPNDVVK